MREGGGRWVHQGEAFRRERRETGIGETRRFRSFREIRKMRAIRDPVSRWQAGVGDVRSRPRGVSQVRLEEEE